MRYVSQWITVAHCHASLHRSHLRQMASIKLALGKTQLGQIQILQSRVAPVGGAQQPVMTIHLLSVQ